MKRKRIIWLLPERFDDKPDKSTWLEMSRELSRLGHSVNLVSGRRDRSYQVSGGDYNIVLLDVLDKPLIFRIHLLLKMRAWVTEHCSADDIFIVNQDALYLAPYLKKVIGGMVITDFRTLPVLTKMSPKKILDDYLFWRRSVRKYLPYSDGLSFITERLKDVVGEQFNLNMRHYVIWTSGVNVEMFDRVSDLQEDGNRVVLFYHGSIYPSRGIRETVIAIGALEGIYREKVRLRIVGPEIGEQFLSRLIVDIGVTDRVEWLGVVDYKDIPFHIAGADICICPLPDRLEWQVSSPLKVFEYMAAGKPMILTPIAAHQDVCKGRRYVVWTKGFSSEAIRDAIVEAVDELPCLETKANEAKEEARSKYDWEVQARRFSDYIEGCVSS